MEQAVARIPPTLQQGLNAECSLAYALVLLKLELHELFKHFSSGMLTVCMDGRIWIDPIHFLLA